MRAVLMSVALPMGAAAAAAVAAVVHHHYHRRRSKGGTQPFRMCTLTSTSPSSSCSHIIEIYAHTLASEGAAVGFGEWRRGRVVWRQKSGAGVTETQRPAGRRKLLVCANIPIQL